MKKVLFGVVAAVVAVFVLSMVVSAQDEAPAKKPEAVKKVLVVKGDSASVCACAAGCKCTVNADDATKCSCGKAVEKVSVAGKFVCEKCAVVADKAGKCATCSADLVEVKAPAAVKPVAPVAK